MTSVPLHRLCFAAFIGCSVACNLGPTAPQKASPSSAPPIVAPIAQHATNADKKDVTPNISKQQLPSLPADPDFDVWRDQQLASCTLRGDWGGSNAEMATRGWSEFECFVSRSGITLKRLPPGKRNEVLGARTAYVVGDSWFNDWKTFAGLTSELAIFMQFTSGRFFGGGTMIMSMRPAYFGSVASEVAYWLDAVQHDQMTVLVRRMTAMVSRGQMISQSLATLEVRATRYLAATAETVIPEYYPTASALLEGGDWRRVLYDIRQLRTTVPVLARRMCRSSVDLASALDGPSACSEVLENYLISMIGEIWDDNSGDEEQGRPSGLGLDEAYFPFAMAIYESCELDSLGQTLTYARRVNCLSRVLSDWEHSLGTAVPQRTSRALAVRKYLAAMCSLDSADALRAWSSVPTEEECLAQSNVRATFFLSRWSKEEFETLSAHTAAHRPWGQYVKVQLPKLAARLKKATQAQHKGALPSGSISRLEYERASAGIARTEQAAVALATTQCNDRDSSPISNLRDCEQALSEYWLSYVHVVGIIPDAEAE